MRKTLLSGVPQLSQSAIAEKLRRDMGTEKFKSLLDTINAAGPDAPMANAFDMDKLFEEIAKDTGMVRPMAPNPESPHRNFEAAIYSRLTVLGGSHNFDLMKVHRVRDGSKFYVFVVVNDKWVVLEDDELFPSDKLIAALRCLTL